MILPLIKVDKEYVDLASSKNGDEYYSYWQVRSNEIIPVLY